jgi:hypothetical protein
MRMTACFLPFNIKESYVKNPSKYRFVTPINILICLNKNDAYDVICYLMSASFKLNTFGYNKKINEFWGKRTNKEKCLMQINLQINEIDINSSYVVITPVVGTSYDINKFIDSFIQCIRTYEKSYLKFTM